MRVGKRDLLIEICENPGWAPPSNGGSEHLLEQLLNEGWVTTRLDGWVASPKALEEYPRFLSQEDIADPEAGRVIVDETGRKETVHVPESRTIALQRLAVWCSHCQSMVPLKETPKDYPVLSCANCRRSIAHAEFF